MRFAASEPITSFLKRKENYQNLAGQAAMERAYENAAISEAEGLMAGTGLQAKADIKSAKLGAAATRYAGQQAGNAAMFGGAMQGLAGLAGGAISKYGSTPSITNTSSIGSGVGQASLTPGIDVRSDFSNRINPIQGFGGVLNA